MEENKIIINQEQIIESENKLLHAIKCSNVPVLDELLHNDLLFITPAGQVVTKAMDLAAHRAGNMIVNEISSTIEFIHLIANTAVVVLVIETKGEMFSQPIAGKFRYSRVWRLFDDKWQVIAGSCTQV